MCGLQKICLVFLFINKVNEEVSHLKTSSPEVGVAAASMKIGKTSALLLFITNIN